MPLTTWIEDGHVVGALPTGHVVRVPLEECAEAAGVEIGADEVDELRSLNGATLTEAIMGLDDEPIEVAQVGEDDGDEVGARKKRKAKRKARRKRIKAKLKKAVKKVAKVAKSKVFKGIAKIVSSVVPAPFSTAITAAKGAAKFAKMVKAKKKHPHLAKAVALVRAGAAGKLTGAQLSAAASKIGFDGKLLNEAAVIKRVALQSAKDPRAAAALKLAKDVTSSSPLRQDLALAAAAQAQAGPNARAFVVSAPGGEVYRTLVQTGS